MRILICDDEGIVQESLKFIIHKDFGEKWETESAKNGRQAIEMAESFRPDIILMDIQMPGINGIEAMKEIRRENKNVIFIVLTAYDKFEYTQKSIDIGVMAYLMKPIKRDEFVETLARAMKLVDARKEKLRMELRNKEKLETVVPMIENGFVYSILLDEHSQESSVNYRGLLDIKTEYGYVIVLECGDEFHQGKLTNAIGAGIRLQKHYMVLREIVKEELAGAIVGALLSNKVIILIPCESEKEDYDERIVKIDLVRRMIRNLERQIGLKFKVGIGSVKSWNEMRTSYQEARDTEKQGVSKVTHARDLPVTCVYEEGYPYDLEKELFSAVEEGNGEKAEEKGGLFITWLKGTYPELGNVARLKIMEFVLWAEHTAYMHGGMTYRVASREGYLESLLEFQTYEQMERWFVRKLKEASYHIAINKQEKANGVVEKAKEYMQKHFSKDLSLEVTAKMLGISPYYFSKLFKESEHINYIDYLTGLRINYAKEQLSDSEKSIKEICVESGYGDPNYFSRIFKKMTGVTPTEYRRGKV